MTNSRPELGSKPRRPACGAKVWVAKDNTAAYSTQYCYNEHYVPLALQAAGVGAANL